MEGLMLDMVEEDVGHPIHQIQYQYQAYNSLSVT